MGDNTSWRSILATGLARTGIDGLARLSVDALADEWDVLRDDPDLRELARRGAAANLALVAEVARGDLDLAASEPPPQAVAYARPLGELRTVVAHLGDAFTVLSGMRATSIEARLDLQRA